MTLTQQRGSGWGRVQYSTRHDFIAEECGGITKGLTSHAAIQSRTDFGASGYGGPCPPPGDKPHHYQITVFAVDVETLPDAKNDSASAALVGFDLHFHVGQGDLDRPL
jgi:phosphatidylethanolamine-binding protein (PEBP) family uncharacterized protein